VFTLSEAIEHPHLRERETVRRVHDDHLGEFDIPGFPAKFSRWSTSNDLRAPLLGEHNSDVLQELLGLSEEQIAALYGNGVLVQDPLEAKTHQLSWTDAQTILMVPHMTTIHVDLFVIGAGSGGVRAARIAAGHGATVAIAEQSRVGGTCVIRGCVPKKIFVYASSFGKSFSDATGFGWHLSNARFDWPTLLRNKNTEIARLEGLYRSGLAKAGLLLIDGRAVVEDIQTVRIEGTDRRYRARRILIATGGTPNREFNLPGIEHAIDSDAVFELEKLPRSVLIVGGGYIAVEFAGIMQGLGVQTALLHRGKTCCADSTVTCRRKLSGPIANAALMCDLTQHSNVLTGDKIVDETAEKRCSSELPWMDA
jgi:hypothetical protein